MAYNSFYGGRRGQPFLFSKTFKSKEELYDDTSVFIGQYALISTESSNDPENGLIYKRISNNKGKNSWQFLGKISGPPGPPPITEIVDYSDPNFDSKTEGYQQENGYLYKKGSISALNNGNFIPGDGDEPENQQIRYKILSQLIKDGNVITGALNKIGLQIPYLIPDPSINSQYYGNFNSDIKIEVEKNNSKPLNPKWIFSIPKGKPGNYITNIRTKEYRSNQSSQSSFWEKCKYFDQEGNLQPYSTKPRPNANSPLFEDKDLFLICDYIQYKNQKEQFNDNNPDHNVYTVILGEYATIRSIQENKENGEIVLTLTDNTTFSFPFLYPSRIELQDAANGEKSVKVTYSDSNYEIIGTIQNKGGLLGGFGLKVIKDTEQDIVSDVQYTNETSIKQNITGLPLVIQDGNSEINLSQIPFTIQEENFLPSLDNIIAFLNEKKIIISSQKYQDNNYRGQLISVQIPQGDSLNYYCLLFDNFTKKWISLGSLANSNISLRTGVQTNNKDNDFSTLNENGGLIILTEEEKKKITYKINNKEEIIKTIGPNYYGNSNEKIEFFNNNDNKKMKIKIEFNGDTAFIEMDYEEKNYGLSSNSAINIIQTNSIEYKDGYLSFYLNNGENTTESFTITADLQDRTQNYLIREDSSQSTDPEEQQEQEETEE